MDQMLSRSFAIRDEFPAVNCDDWRELLDAELQGGKLKRLRVEPDSTIVEQALSTLASAAARLLQQLAERLGFSLEVASNVLGTD